MVLQSSMGQYQLDVRYGDRNTLPYYNGVLDSGLLGRTDVGAIATAGKVYTLATNGSLTVGPTVQGTMPFFGWSGMDVNNYPDTQRSAGMPGYLDKPEDVNIDVGGTDTTLEGIGAPNSPGWPGIPNRAASTNVAGGFATIRHNAAAELATTAFAVDEPLNSFNAVIGDTGVAVSDYTPGTALTAIAVSAAGTATDQVSAIGLLVPVQNAADPVYGYVAPAGVLLGAAGYLQLAFTPTYIPGANLVRLVSNTLTSAAAAGGDTPIA